MKRFLPLENNPEVMNKLTHKLGLSSALSFHDVFSIDEPELLGFVPRPTLALLLVFPVSETYQKFRQTEDADKTEYTGHGPGEEVVWYKQTIRNACGIMGLLHGLSNGAAREYITPGSELAQLVQQAETLPPVERAKLLENSAALEAAHQAAAATGDTAAPALEDEVDLHYVCFVKSRNGHLWELDGSRKGPLDRGLLSEDEDVLSELALDKGVRSFLKREQEIGGAGSDGTGGELRFSLVALAPALD